MTKRLLPGDGNAQPIPANSVGVDLCGVLYLKKKKKWCTLNVPNKVFFLIGWLVGWLFDWLVGYLGLSNPRILIFSHFISLGSWLVGWL